MYNIRSIGDCLPATGDCARDPRFRKGNEFTYWAPLEFTEDGSILPFKPFQNTVTIDVADNGIAMGMGTGN